MNKILYTLGQLSFERMLNKEISFLADSIQLPNTDVSIKEVKEILEQCGIYQLSCRHDLNSDATDAVQVFSPVHLTYDEALAAHYFAEELSKPESSLKQEKYFNEYLSTYFYECALHYASKDVSLSDISKLAKCATRDIDVTSSLEIKSEEIARLTAAYQHLLERTDERTFKELWRDQKQLQFIQITNK